MVWGVSAGVGRGARRRGASAGIAPVGATGRAPWRSLETGGAARVAELSRHNARQLHRGEAQLAGVALSRKPSWTLPVWKARELTAELGVLLANDPVSVRHGRKIVEITRSTVSKGAAVARLLRHRSDDDLVLCAGDDETDESMFTLEAKHIISIKIGTADTRAAYRIPTPADFRSLPRAMPPLNSAPSCPKIAPFEPHRGD